MLKPGSFAPRSTAKTLKHHSTTISYSDSKAGVTTLTVERVAPGYRLGHQACKALSPRSKRPEHSKACTVAKTVGSFTHRDTAGSNSFPFTGRLQGRSLTAGSYLLNATPVLGALRGTTRTAKFHIV